MSLVVRNLLAKEEEGSGRDGEDPGCSESEEDATSRTKSVGEDRRDPGGPGLDAAEEGVFG